MDAIRTDGLTKRYGGGLFGTPVTAVRDLDLVVREGEVFGFLGPNGAGKSTTIDMLLDYARPTGGSVRVLGRPVEARPDAISRRVGVLPEGYGLYDRLTGRRNLELAVDWNGGDDDVGRLLDRVGVDPDDAARRVGEYSKGMTQRLALAMALSGDPDLLILDEPSSGLDPNGVRRLREIVGEAADGGTTVFFSSHVLDQVQAVCDRVGILDDGELVAVDTVEGLREAGGAGSTLELTMNERPSADLVGDEGVAEVDVRGNRLRIACTDSRAKARVVADLVDGGHDVVDVSSESTSLGDVFAAYTEGDDEDGPGETPDPEARSEGMAT
ncbi:MAG: ABC transporter ATP-binding protein [Haloferacaceae archaeon]